MKPDARTEASVRFEIGVPKDIGWAIATVHADGTVTRTCKGCGLTVVNAIGPGGQVRGVFHHRAGCSVVERLAAINSDGGRTIW